MTTVGRTINCPEAMSRAIRKYGIVPFFKSGIPGWSIEEMTAPGYWFFEDNDGELGPWDWKVDVVQEGDIAYGKFLGGKAAFATVELYRELMNWRRSIPKYRMAEGARYKAVTKSEQLMKKLSPIALNAIREAGALESRELRLICSAATGSQVKKNTMDSVMQFLQMGTWSVIGDIRREFKGPNLTYSGWQRASNTTPDALFGEEAPESDAPFWAKHIEEPQARGPKQILSPEESRLKIIDRIRGFFPDADEKILLKLI